MHLVAYSLGDTQVARIQRFRIPVTSWSPDTYYIVNLDRESRMPTVAELVILRSYQVYAATTVYREPYAQRILAKPFPAEGGHNTVTVKKLGRDRWVYRRISWTSGPTYAPTDENYRQTGIALVALLDKINTYVDETSPQWTKWKQDHPEVFRAPVPA